MIRRSEYFETIDKYLSNELTAPELSELEQELKLNSDLEEELKLQVEVLQAVQEQEIVSLRENLKKVAADQGITNKSEEFIFSGSFNFGLAEEISSSAQNFSRTVNTEDIINFSQSFPKIHLYQHNIAAKENIHQFYKEQTESDSLYEEEPNYPLENALFEEIKIALGENDVLDIRANLKQIATTMPEHSRSTEEIYDYIYNQMSPEERAEFDEELDFNAKLAKDVQLYRDIDMAAGENDIMELRASLRKIQKAELQTTTRIEEIEDYIYDRLTESEMTSFEAELANSKELYSEIELVKNIDKALQENDIMQLRAKLGNIANDNLNEKQAERSIGFKFRHRKIALSVVAASLILLLGITGLLSKYTSEGDVYQKFYAKYETTGISRSSNTEADKTLSIALQKFNDQEYETALKLLQEVISKDNDNPVGHFYSGVTLQELGKYQHAIEEYQAVVINKDNLFVEQAQWYIGLCYLQTSESEKAIKQFRKIANGNGFYQPKAVAILNKLEDIN